MIRTTTESRFNGHSMVGALKRVLVCSPRTACWHQPERAARWRELGFVHPPDFEMAQAQHRGSVSRIAKRGRGGRRNSSGHRTFPRCCLCPRCVVADRFWLDPDASRQSAIAFLKANITDRFARFWAFRCWPRLRLRPPRKLGTWYGLTPRRCSSATAIAPTRKVFSRCVPCSRRKAWRSFPRRCLTVRDLPPACI